MTDTSPPPSDQPPEPTETPAPAPPPPPPAAPPPPPPVAPPPPPPPGPTPWAPASSSPPPVATPLYAQQPPGQPPGGAPPYGTPPYGQAPPGAPGYGAPPYGAPPYGQPPAGAPYGYATGPVDGQGRPLAEWWQRAVAIIIDTVMLGVVFAILRGIFAGGNAVVFNSNGSTTVHTGHLVIAEIIEILITLAYFGIFDGSERGQTLGKMALGIATRDINTGGRIGTPRAVLRRFIYSVLWVIFFIPGLINALSPLWDPRRQAWHDKAVSSDVIKVR